MVLIVAVEWRLQHRSGNALFVGIAILIGQSAAKRGAAEHGSAAEWIARQQSVESLHGIRPQRVSFGRSIAVIRLYRETTSRTTAKPCNPKRERGRMLHDALDSSFQGALAHASGYGAESQGASCAPTPRTPKFSLATAWVLIVSSTIGLSGCAAFRPIEGIPARYVPDEVKAPSRSGKKTIDLSLLSQTQPRVYHLDTGDVLAVYIEGVIPRPGEMPPVNMPQYNEEASPALGYPIPIRQDGTISLPLLPRALPVRGMTVAQVEAAVRRAYTVDRKILQSGNERVWVILHKPRQYRVLVIRQEGVEQPMMGQAGMANLGALKRGTGRVVALTAYKNDVLHALAETGGLPGLDAENTIYVLRAKRRPPINGGPKSWTPQSDPNAGWSVSPQLPAGLPAYPSAIPPLPEGSGSYSTSPLPNGPAPILPGASSSDPNEPIAPSADPTAPMNDPAHDAAIAPGPQTHKATSANSGVQLAVLSFEATASENRVTPAAFQTATPNRVAKVVPGTVPMLAQNQDWQAGLPPTHSAEDWPEMSADAWMGHTSVGDQTLAGQNIAKIPVRLSPGEQVNFTERDILLEDGDIVFIESRDTEIFYTGGLLGGGQYTLPRDYDLDVLGAIAIAQAGRAQASQNRATGGVSAMNQDVTISASQAIILRKMPNGTQVPIKVDLYRAVRHPQERVLMQPGDYLVLQYTPMEACGAFVERHLLEGALFGVASASLNKR